MKEIKSLFWLMDAGTGKERIGCWIPLWRRREARGAAKRDPTAPPLLAWPAAAPPIHGEETSENLAVTVTFFRP